MMKFVILCALVVAATADPIPPLRSTSRIIGGAATTIEQVPFQVSIQVFGVQYCGGAIISSSWILSAAHCFIFPPSWYNVRSGSSLYASGGTLTAAANIITHEQYSQDSWNLPINDIALVQLTTPLTFGSTQTSIALFTTGELAVAGTTATISGWGALRRWGSKSDNLHAVSARVGTNAECNVAYSSWGAIPDGQSCIGVDEDSPSSCDGDGGSPVVINGALAGILSLANGCEYTGFPSVFTEVGAYRVWIAVNSGI